MKPRKSKSEYLYIVLSFFFHFFSSTKVNVVFISFFFLFFLFVMYCDCALWRRFIFVLIFLSKKNTHNIMHTKFQTFYTGDFLFLVCAELEINSVCVLLFFLFYIVLLLLLLLLLLFFAYSLLIFLLVCFYCCSVFFFFRCYTLSFYKYILVIVSNTKNNEFWMNFKVDLLYFFVLFKLQMKTDLLIISQKRSFGVPSIWFILIILFNTRSFVLQVKIIIKSSFKC